MAKTAKKHGFVKSYLLAKVEPPIPEEIEYALRTNVTIDNETVTEEKYLELRKEYDLRYAPRSRIVDWYCNAYGLAGNMAGVLIGIAPAVAYVADEKGITNESAVICALSVFLVPSAYKWLGNMGERIGYKIGKRQEARLLE